MIIKKFISFLESVKQEKKLLPYFFSRDLYVLVKDLKNTTTDNDVKIIAGIILTYHDLQDEITFIDIPENEGMLSFIQVNRVERIWQNATIQPPSLFTYAIDIYTRNRDYGEKSHPVWNSQRTDISIGKFVTRLIQKTGIALPPPAKIENFVNAFKAFIKQIKEKDSNFSIVSGEKIKYWYLEDNYQYKIGQLANSCMRGKYCQDFFGIYVENPEVCKLLILKGTDPGKIIGRALLWTLDSGETFMDRIYTNNDSDINVFRDYGKKNNWLMKAINERDWAQRANSTITLSAKEFDQFPYMDTFKYLDVENGILAANVEPLRGQNEELNNVYELSRSDGGHDYFGKVYSDYYSDYIDEDDAVWSDEEDTWILLDDAIYLEDRDKYYLVGSEYVVYNEIDEKYIHVYDAVWSEYSDTYIPIDSAIEYRREGRYDTDFLHPKYEDKTIEVEIDGIEMTCLKKDVEFIEEENKWVFRK